MIKHINVTNDVTWGGVYENPTLDAFSFTSCVFQFTFGLHLFSLSYTTSFTDIVYEDDLARGNE
jgi:hypothetical protein